MPEPRVILDGLAYVESPRWHDGRLWFAHWGTDEIVAVDLDGNSEVVAHGPGGLGWSIDWLPDGRLLVTGPGLLRHEPDGSVVPHAELGALAGDWNEVVVDGRGNAYANGGMFGPPDGGPSGMIALVTPDGSVRRVAEGLAFPNGMAITPDNRTLIVAESWAEGLTAYDIARRRLALGAPHLGGDARRPSRWHLPRCRWRRLVRRCRQRALRARPRGRRGTRDDRPRSRRVRLHARRSGRPDAVHAGGRVAWLRARGRGDRGSHGPGAGRRCACAPRRLAVGDAPDCP